METRTQGGIKDLFFEVVEPPLAAWSEGGRCKQLWWHILSCAEPLGMDHCWGNSEYVLCAQQEALRAMQICGGKSQWEGLQTRFQCIHKEMGKKQFSGKVLAGKHLGVLNGEVLSPAGRTQWGKGNRALYILCRKIGVHQRNIWFLHQLLLLMETVCLSPKSG